MGFRGDEYTRAVRIFGRPHYVHIRWDRRAQRDISPDDTVVFATGTADDAPSQWTGPDIIEDLCLHDEQPTSTLDKE